MEAYIVSTAGLLFMLTCATSLALIEPEPDLHHRQAVQVLITTFYVPWACIYGLLNSRNLLSWINYVTGHTTLEPENG